MSRPDDARIIGLIGGLSWPSTITYYREINRIVQSRLGGSHSARLLIWSDDYHQVEQMQLNGQWREAGEWLADSAARLEAGGADLLGIACNTMHNVADAIQGRTALPLIDIVDVACAACAANDCPTAVLGTSFTVRNGRFVAELDRRGSRPIIPSGDDMAELDRLIYEELCLGQVSERARHILERIIARLAAQGAGQILLACTELNLLIGTESLDGVRIIDAARVHIEALADASLAKRREDDRHQPFA